MEVIIGIILILVIGAIVKTAKDSKERKKFNDDNIVIPPHNPQIADLPTGNYCIIDECTPEVAAGRETNGAQDVLAQLFLLISETGTKPAFIGVSCGEHGVNKQPTIDAIKELCLNIPVLEGAPTYAGAKSELSDAIVEHSKKGAFKIYLGSPAGDVARAFKDGAHIHNIRLPRLLEHTWNEEINYVAAKYVLDRLQDKSGAVTEYYELIKRSNLPAKFQDTHTFINLNRTLKAWDLANSPEILKRNQELNAGIKDNTGVLRIADVLCVAKDLGFEKDIARTFNGIQHGMDICKDRIALGAVETLVQSTPPQSPPLDRTPINRNTFNQSNCKVYGGTRNPFRYKKTSVIQSASIGINSHTIRHTKAGTWAGKTYQSGRKIDGTHGIVSYDRETKQWYVFMFEYSVIGEPRRPKGWKFLNWIQQGDPVGLIASTNTRSPQWDVRGQAKERTNIYWVTA